MVHGTQSGSLAMSGSLKTLNPRHFRDIAAHQSNSDDSGMSVAQKAATGSVPKERKNGSPPPGPG
jgi:hypothetical protein